MIEVLLYSTINCTDASDMVKRMQENEYIAENIRVELIEVLQEATPHCPWDAND
tara:strand:+ start:3178 stop:3339 length:162 start_codon:yes stop_codon:yes gene_type:complete